jgi:hypothetical protein
MTQPQNLEYYQDWCKLILPFLESSQALTALKVLNNIKTVWLSFALRQV